VQHTVDLGMAKKPTNESAPKTKRGRPAKAATKANPKEQKLEALAEETVRTVMGAIMLEAEPVPEDVRFKAQDVFYSAMELQREDAIMRRLLKAVRTDPNNPDAMLSLVQALVPENQPEYIVLLEGIVKAGWRGLGGEKFAKENAGYFWGILETRGYMRARAALAEAFHAGGRTQAAIREFEGLLELNPNDNQGLRYSFLGVLLETGELQRASNLLGQYKDEGSAMWAWGRVLTRFLESKLDDAATALSEARKVNPHAEVYLNATRQLPEHLPEYYGFGDENEGIVCAVEIGDAWKKYPNAVKWLWEQG
jgi:tetratricopeptide (TPR) repeat protein